MTSQVAPFPNPAGRSPSQRPVPLHRVSIDGEYADDELPPELFDHDEDLEELAFYVHMAERAHDE